MADIRGILTLTYITGSFAAAWQSSIGNVVGGSLFATLTSAGAKGAGLATVTAGTVGASGGAGTACLAIAAAEGQIQGELRRVMATTEKAVVKEMTGEITAQEKLVCARKPPALTEEIKREAQRDRRNYAQCCWSWTCQRVRENQRRCQSWRRRASGVSGETQRLEVRFFFTSTGRKCCWVESPCPASNPSCITFPAQSTSLMPPKHTRSLDA